MSYITMNAGAILAATIAGLLFGAVYASLVWRRRPGEASGNMSAGFIGLACMAEFWLASILAGAVILAPPQGSPWIMALGSAVVIWIGFVLPTLLVTQHFNGLPLGRGLLNCGHWLIVMLIQAAILQYVGLVRPA